MNTLILTARTIAALRQRRARGEHAFALLEEVPANWSKAWAGDRRPRHGPHPATRTPMARASADRENQPTPANSPTSTTTTKTKARSRRAWQAAASTPGAKKLAVQAFCRIMDDRQGEVSTSAQKASKSRSKRKKTGRKPGFHRQHRPIFRGQSRRRQAGDVFAQYNA